MNGWNISSKFTLFLCLGISGLLLQACNSDDPVAPEPETGNIEINVTPDSINATWQLSGPDNYLKVGSGDLVIPEVAIGTYTLEWGDVSGWEMPSPSTISNALESEATIMFIGTYQEIIINGTIVVDPSPDSLNAPWLLSGPGSFTLDGTGDLTITDLVPGIYSLAWGEITGWVSPADSTIPLDSGSTNTFSGTYEEEILQYPSDPDKLMQNFDEIYNNMLIDAFRDMLHEDFRTVLLPSTLQEWAGGGNPLADDVFYRDDEIQIHENMFSGNPGLDPAGIAIPPIDSIQVDYLVKNGDWEPIPDADENFGGHGGYWALFNVLIYFHNPDFHRYEVRQDVAFYVVPTDDGGRVKWLLLGVRGLEPNLGLSIATDSASFGGVKSLYR